MPVVYGVKGAVNRFFDELDKSKRNRSENIELGERRRRQKFEDIEKFGAPLEELEQGYKSIGRLRRKELGPDSAGEAEARNKYEEFESESKRERESRIQKLGSSTPKLSFSDLQQTSKNIRSIISPTEEQEEMAIYAETEMSRRIKAGTANKPVKVPEKKKVVFQEEKPRSLKDRLLGRNKEIPKEVPAEFKPSPISQKISQKKKDKDVKVTVEKGGKRFALPKHQLEQAI